MTKEQKDRTKKLLSSYGIMKLQVECINNEINITKECIESLKDIRNTESYITESNNKIKYKLEIKKRLENYINKIDKALNELSDTERK
ncbi:hypothetical protein ACSW9N_13280 [Clostridium perfringens]|nr:hypothetical protein [Clostridium perfringens]